MATTDKSKAKATESEKDEKVAGTDKSQTSQTTKAAEEKKDAQPTEAEKVEKSDTEGASTGSVEGGVVRGDVGLEEDAEVAEDAFFEGSQGTVLEADREGNQYDVPYVYVTAEDVTGEKTRTSDSDDGDARAWNAQWAAEEREDLDDPVALVPVQGTPGQTFGVHELPNREVAEAAGIDYAQWVAGLPVRGSVPDEAPRKGTPA